MARRNWGPTLHNFLHGYAPLGEVGAVFSLRRQLNVFKRRHGVADADAIALFVTQVVDDALDGDACSQADRSRARAIAEAIIAEENYFPRLDEMPISWLSMSDIWQARANLLMHISRLQNFDTLRKRLIALLRVTLLPLMEQASTHCDEDDMSVTVRRIDRIGDLPKIVETIVAAPFEIDDADPVWFPVLQARLEDNIIIASGGNPGDRAQRKQLYRLPLKPDGRPPESMVATYLAHTPFQKLFDGEEPFVIPMTARMEHHHIIGGTGHGKTQTLQAMIARDLKAVEQGQRSVVVIDSQGDLIRTISRLQEFAPGHPLHDRICIIDPTDIEYPVSLNLFDIGQERLTGYTPLERERLTNSVLELYDFVLGTLLAAEMTQKQNVIFRYVTRLMLHIPNATIHTLRELMEEGSEVKFAGDIAKLEGSARHFFNTEFASSEFRSTRRQVLRRLWGILENQTFERMFSHPRSKFDLFTEMNSGKVILINTAKDLLKETGTEIFGRFFIAMIAQAAQERAVLKPTDRMDTIVYVDEAADYFDRNIGIILSQARKYRIGMVLAHQYLGQLDPKLQDAFSANTAIKFAGGFSGREARAAAQMLGCDASFVEGQKKGSFAATVRGLTNHPVSLKFPFGVLEDKARMTKEEFSELRGLMRQRYAVHISELKNGLDEPDEAEPDGGSRSDGPPVSGKPDKPKGKPGDVDRSDPDKPDTKAGDKW